MKLPSKFYIVLLFTACILAQKAFAAVDKSETKYTVSSKGFNIGSAVTTQTITPDNALHYENHTKIKSRILFFSYNLDLEEAAHIKDGKTLEYSRKANDNGKDIETEGKLEDGEFKINTVENKKHKNISFNTNQYDYTTIDGPEFIVDFKDTNDITLRILDLEYLAIVKRTYHYVKTETIEVDGRKFTCKVIDLSDLHKTARRWIYRNGDKAAILRQEGKGKDGSYTIKAVSISKS